jgi:peptidoglycan/xylan/chitin deacetylase (PgdA/CDA1 family)
MSFSDCKSGSAKTVVVTTSWDDGDRCDLKLAELLASRGLPATFYVPTGGLGQASTLSTSDLREFANAGFEIGAHTVTHPVLTDLSGPALTREIVECKHVLQEILGREVVSFAYPKGRRNAETITRVKQAGYHGARGLRMLSLGFDFPLFDMPVTVQAYPHPRSSYIKNLIRRGGVMALARSSADIGRSKNWVQLGKEMFDRALREGGVWHLLGHSWETEKLGRWPELKEIMDYVSGREGVRYLTNGELSRLAHGLNAPAVAAGAR